MALGTNSHIKLDIYEPKTQAVIGDGTGVPTVGADEMAIYWAAFTGYPLSSTSAIQKQLAKLCDLVLSNPAEMPTDNVSTGVISNPLTSFVIDGAPGLADVAIYIGSNIGSKSQTHYFKRTFDRLMELYLEYDKDNGGLTS